MATTTATQFADTHGSDDLRRLKEHSVAAIKVGIVAADFLKKKAALQERYVSELNALVETCRLRTQPSQQTGIQGFEDTPALLVWEQVKSLSLKEAERINVQSTECKNIASELSTVLTRKKRMMKMVFADVQELERGVKSLEQVCEKSRQANDASAKAAATAAAEPTGMMKKISDNKIVGGIFSKLKKGRVSAKEQTELNAYNDYVLQVVSTNAQKNKFYKTDLPQALAAAQDIYVSSTKQIGNSIQGAGESQIRAAIALKDIHEGVAAKAKEVDGQAAVGLVVSKLKIDMTSPGWSEVEFTTQDGSSKPTLNVQDADTASQLRNRLGAIERETAQLATEMSKQVKSVDGLERLYQQYATNPSFGSPDDVFENLYGERKQVRNILTRMQRNNAVIASMQSVNITSEPDETTDTGSARAMVVSMAGEEEDWDGSDDEAAVAQAPAAVRPADEGPRRGLALYDYVPQNSAVGEEIALVAGEVINDIEEVDEHWSRGRVANRHGLFPASYCHFFYGDPANQVISLYDYTAAGDHEMSIVADEVLKIVEPDDHGWTLVVRESDRVQGLVPTSYIDKNFVKLPASVKAAAFGLSPSMAVSGMLDDLDGETEDVEEQPGSEYLSVEGQPPAQPKFTEVTSDVGGSSDDWSTAPAPAVLPTGSASSVSAGDRKSLPKPRCSPTDNKSTML